MHARRAPPASALESTAASQHLMVRAVAVGRFAPHRALGGVGAGRHRRLDVGGDDAVESARDRVRPVDGEVARERETERGLGACRRLLDEGRQRRVRHGPVGRGDGCGLRGTLRDNPAGVRADDDRDQRGGHEDGLEDHVDRTGEIKEHHERPRRPFLVVEHLRHNHKRRHGVEQCADEQLAVEPRPPRRTRVHQSDDRVRDARHQTDGACDPTPREDIVKTRLFAEGELRGGDRVKVLDADLVPAGGPADALPPEGAQVGGGELA
mmetsp:Transcript_43201/g.106694  ORF Transcript_43201/g.106694 Transcript_43201/m.106694 type:complete len:266 (+) Transcript_43201:221-1018(+)